MLVWILLAVSLSLAITALRQAYLLHELPELRRSLEWYRQDKESTQRRNAIEAQYHMSAAVHLMRDVEEAQDDLATLMALVMLESEARD